MQVEVSVQRVLEIMGRKLSEMAVENARLVATNEVLTERLHEYVNGGVETSGPPNDAGLSE